MNLSELQSQLQAMGHQARVASGSLSQADTAEKKRALRAIADGLQNRIDQILEANTLDVDAAEQAGRGPAFIDRLRLNADRVKAIASAILSIAELEDPVSRVLATWQRPNGLRIQRVSVPLGVVGVIFESRPGVTADVAALCLLSGNCAILRGGSESFHSSQAIMQCVQDGIATTTLPPQCVQMIQVVDRQAVGVMLQMDKYIDVIIPRGGQALIERITRESSIPLFKHLQGLCHTYIHQGADKTMAIDIVLNAKLRRPGICGATETVLIDTQIASDILPDLITALHERGCEVRADEFTCQIDPAILAATESDWQTEYLDKVVSIKCVADINEAIEHIRCYGSQHTDAIISNDSAAATQFLREVDSAIVMHNASTQFADGGEFGMGAEIGISTGKLHARGPVGVEQLTTFHYRVYGDGQCRPE